MSMNQCSSCDCWFHEDEGGCLCPDCKKEAEEKRLKEIAELYEIPGGSSENNRP